MGVFIGYGRNTLPEADWSATPNAGGSITSAKVLYLAIQGYNLAGYNILSVRTTTTTVNATEQIDISISALMRLAGESWLGYVISASTSSDPTTMVQLAKVRAVDPLDNESILAFPLTLTLDEDDHIALSVVLNDDTEFPTTTILHGMRRALLSTGLVYEYDQYDQNSVIDNQIIFDGPGSVGRWKATNGFSSYIPDITSEGGCAQDMRDIVDGDTVQTFNYESTASLSAPVTLWLSNDNNTIVPQGARVAMNVRIGELNKSNLFDQKLELTFLGFVDLNTLALRTTDGVDPLPSVGVPQNYSAQTPNLILEDDMTADEVYVFNVKLKFADFQLGGFVPDGSYIRLLPSFILASGVYSEAGAILGNGIFPEDNFRRVVPGAGLSVIALEGSGIVQNYVFPTQPEEVIFGYTAATDNQVTVINQNGNVYVTIAPITGDATQRALVGTLAGESSPGALSTQVTTTLATDGITLTLTHPFAVDATGTIRSDYPDVIAGLVGKAVANPFEVAIYLRHVGSGVIKQFNVTTLQDPTQIVALTDWNAGVTVGSFPGAAAANFSLFAPGTTSLAVTALGGVNFPIGSYEALYTFSYNGNQVTRISHDTLLGNIYEFTLTLAEVFAASSYWREAVADVPALQALASDLLFTGIQRKILDVGGVIKDYIYEALNTETPDGDNVIIPDDITHPAPGRWIWRDRDRLTLADIRKQIFIYSNP